MNFLEFMESRTAEKESRMMLTEAFKSSEIDKVHHLIADLVTKKVGSKCVLIIKDFDTKIDGKKMISYLFYIKDCKSNTPAFTLNYLVSGKRSEVYSIDFFDNSRFGRLFFDGERINSNLSIYTLGTSVAYFIPIIVHVILNDDYDLNEEKATKIGDQSVKITKRPKASESREYHYGAATYKVYEGMSDDDVDMVFNAKMKFLENELEDLRRQKSAELSAAKKEGDSEKIRQLTNEYSSISKIIRGGATTIEELNMRVKRGVKYEIVNDPKTEEAEVEFEKKTKDPSQTFKEMQMYIKSVIKGLQPGLIICGGPGTGKSYRVTSQLKASGFNDGHNMYIIKGKCTTRSLYLTLYDYQDKGDIVVIDDADSLVGPKAPEDCINILKAALDNPDTADGRKISYKVSGKLQDDEGNDVPKQFYYKGGVIVITNYFVGQLDTALRNRVFTQNIDFTTKQMLKLIEDLLPSIEKNKLSIESKGKALEYLNDLEAKGSKMEISIRSFAMCARIFQTCQGEDGFSDDDAKSMIEEQMNNMFARGGSKY